MTTDAARDADHELAERLRAAVGELVRRVKTGDGLPETQAVALGLLDREGPATIAALADRAHVRHQSMAAIIERLRDRGDVGTERHPNDGRAVRVTITTAGRAVLDAERARRAERVAAIIAEAYPNGDRGRVAEAVAVIEALAYPTR